MTTTFFGLTDRQWQWLEATYRAFVGIPPMPTPEHPNLDRVTMRRWALEDREIWAILERLN